MTFLDHVTKLSVRTRIVVLALVPVVGFLANGIAFKIGESEVSNAFDSVKHASSLADAAQEFKDSLAAMRISARDFATRPGADQIQSFEDSHQRAQNSLNEIERRSLTTERRDIDGLGA